MSYLVHGVRPLSLLLALGAIAAYRLPATGNDVRALCPAHGTSRLSVVVKRGASLIGIDPVRISLSVRGEERSDFSLLAHDGHWSLFYADAVEAEFIENGSERVAVISVGSGFSPLAIKGGVVSVELAVPSSWRGSLSVSSFDGDLTVCDMRLEGCAVEHGRGLVRMERMAADRLSASIRDSDGEFQDVAAGRGEISSRLGRITARRMSGSWNVDGKDGRVIFEAGEGFGGLRIGTRLGGVRLSLPGRSAFSFMATATGPGRVKSALPLVKSEGRAKRYRYTQGSGGPDVLVETRDGLVTLELL